MTRMTNVFYYDTSALSSPSTPLPVWAKSRLANKKNALPSAFAYALYLNAVSHFYRTPSPCVTFEASGKPKTEQFSLSFSHSANFVAVAVGGASVGVDVEKMREISFLLSAKLEKSLPDLTNVQFVESDKKTQRCRYIAAQIDKDSKNYNINKDSLINSTDKDNINNSTDASRICDNIDKGERNSDIDTVTHADCFFQSLLRFCIKEARAKMTGMAMEEVLSKKVDKIDKYGISAKCLFDAQDNCYVCVCAHLLGEKVSFIDCTNLFPL